MKKRALISVFDKTQITGFAKALHGLGWEIISTGGTYAALQNAGIPVLEVQEVTAFPEMLDGRVKTLHPFIHAGILYRRGDEGHRKAMEEAGLSSVDMVVNNLYPFEAVLNNPAAHHSELIENIDIGGPSMIRAAAKNYTDVFVVVDPADYEQVISRLTAGTADAELRRQLAAKAFNYTAYYDALISQYFNGLLNISFPETAAVPYRKTQTLRYGENPHQQAAFYRRAYIPDTEKADFKQLHGKELSYNNFNDIYSAVKMIKEFDEPAAVGIKHGNPSGIGSGGSIDEAFDKMYACDTVSIFGGIIVLNRAVTTHIAEQLNTFFVEIVIAPAFEEAAFAVLTQKKNIRLIEIRNLTGFALPAAVSKEVLNGLVMQDYDTPVLQDELNFVTDRKPELHELQDLLFGFKACKCVSSNGIVVVKNGGTVGIGQGEVRRSWAAEEAVERAGERCEGAVAASDGFFFEDTVELLHRHNIKAVIQPGGSVKDGEVIQRCNTYGIAMVFTGIRHFRH
ncbi:MAG: bifunctional phosphoribosylaminoimidazolecarboxamide formyltransferase/IMP cyclohydrolase [Treponema sp.]